MDDYLLLYQISWNVGQHGNKQWRGASYLWQCPHHWYSSPPMKLFASSTFSEASTPLFPTCSLLSTFIAPALQDRAAFHFDGQVWLHYWSPSPQIAPAWSLLLKPPCATPNNLNHLTSRTQYSNMKDSNTEETNTPTTRIATNAKAKREVCEVRT